MARSSASPVVLIFASIVFGAGAGFIGGQLATPQASSFNETAVSLAEDRLAERLDVLERDYAGLDNRVTSLAVRPLPVVADPALLQPLAQFDPEMVERLERMLATPEDSVAMEDGGALVSSVDAALQQIRASEDAEREEARDDRRTTEIDERLAELSTELSLAIYQVDEMRMLFNESGKEIGELMQSMRDGGVGFMDMREQMTSLREASDTRLSEILSPQQLEDYEAAGGMGFGRGFGGGGGRRGGGPGGG